MADIAMCKGEGCLLRDKCYRHTATPGEHWQSYIAPQYDPDTGQCKRFLEGE